MTKLALFLVLLISGKSVLGAGYGLVSTTISDYDSNHGYHNGNQYYNIPDPRYPNIPERTNTYPGNNYGRLNYDTSLSQFGYTYNRPLPGNGFTFNDGQRQYGYQGQNSQDDLSLTYDRRGFGNVGSVIPLPNSQGSSGYVGSTGYQGNSGYLGSGYQGAGYPTSVGYQRVSGYQGYPTNSGYLGTSGYQKPYSSINRYRGLQQNQDGLYKPNNYGNGYESTTYSSNRAY